jgi:preprotein translocase subunit SecF
MKFFSKVYSFDFMRLRRFWLAFSAVTSVVAIAAMLLVGFKWGIDFSEGTLIELGFDAPIETIEVRTALLRAGFQNVSAQHFGSTREVLVRFRDQLDARNSEAVAAALTAPGRVVHIRRIESVGPQVGSELAETGALALIGALVGILIYVVLRFEGRLALASVVATLHDTILTAGVYLLMPWEFDLTVLAALLTVIGYSINDTIVVFDRIRENFRKMRSASALEVVNASVNQTLSRTLMTGVTTILVLVGMLAFGGELIRPFCVTVLIGLIIGTYSSIYIASPIAVALGVDRKALMPVVKEGADLPNRP